MEKVNRITPEQLERVNADQKNLLAMLTNIGVLESQKHAILHNLATLNESIENFKLELENEYGAVNISLEDGSYTVIEKETKE
jgi:hypothetical protein